jgi:hypothetical protein
MKTICKKWMRHKTAGNAPVSRRIEKRQSSPEVVLVLYTCMAGQVAMSRMPEVQSRHVALRIG